MNISNNKCSLKMVMETNYSLKLLQVCRVSPLIDSPTPLSESFSLPLTYFDIKWLNFWRAQKIFFYQLSQHESTHSFFNSVVLPKLKHSLSLTLAHYLPIAGNIIWPIDTVKPFILYTPNDGVSVIAAESNSDFNHLVKNEMQEAGDLHPYIPELSVSDSKAATIAIQITFFPSQGFSIGVCFQHAVFDAKSITMFMKSWAHMCKENFAITTPLPVKLAPFFDRMVFNYPQEIDMIYLNTWLKSGSDPNPKSLKLLVPTRHFENLVRANFEFSRKDINKLRQKVISRLTEEENAKHIHLSAFVLSLAYTFVCLVKSKKVERKGKIGLKLVVDCRSRLDRPIPSNYIGNCIIALPILMDAEDIIGNSGATEEDRKIQLQHPQTLFPGETTLPPLNGIAFVAKRLSDKIKGVLETRVNISVEQEKKNILEKKRSEESSDVFVGVAWSPKLKIYETDFGWGKPKKIQLVSIDKNGSIYMAESKNGDGGIEVGLVMERHEIEMFNSLFINGLNDQGLRNSRL